MQNNINKWIKDGKIFTIPKKQTMEKELFEYIAMIEFDIKKNYTEKEVNKKLYKYYDDYVLLRRYMVDFGILDRTDNGSCYSLIKH